MISNKALRVAILYAGDREARQKAVAGEKLPKVFEAFQALGVLAEPAVYHDDFCDEVKEQLSQVNAVLVWVNPIEGGRDRSKLDALLCEIAAQGIFVSTHPDIILKLGTKEVLVRTQKLGWGCDTNLYTSLNQMREKLPI